jgi:hypothetical protein
VISGYYLFIYMMEIDVLYTFHKKFVSKNPASKPKLKSFFLTTFLGETLKDYG